jgi:3-oxoacyl-[acyl-carrier-protein] synthase-1
MDGLCRLGLIATELLLRQETNRERFTPCDDRAVILMNHSSSISADKKYLESIADEDNFFPSPSVFVYTLPNIVTGEIAMRNNYHGETSFYITGQRNDELTMQIVSASFADPKTKSIIGGWIDYQDDSHFEADIFITTNNTK